MGLLLLRPVEFDSEASAWVAIEPEDLPISDRLGQSIRRWAAEQTEANNGTEPVSEETRTAWNTRAATLAERLKEELPGDVEVDVD